MDMTSFERVSLEEFNLALDKSNASPRFREQYARYTPQGLEEPHCFVHLGPLKMKGHFAAPGYFTLVTGDLHVDGMVDLTNPEGFDEGGLFVALGDVTCHSFFNEYHKCTFIDGHLDARDLVAAAFGDSALVVTRHLSTNFFYGEDIWAEVGAGAIMEYGDGYCLPIGYTDAAAQALEPKHDAATSLALLDLGKSDGFMPDDLRKHLLAGKPLLKR